MIALRFRKLLVVLSVVCALSMFGAVSAFAQTPVPITAPTTTEILNSGVSMIQMFGLLPFIFFAAFAGAAFMLYKRMKSSSK